MVSQHHAPETLNLALTVLPATWIRSSAKFLKTPLLTHSAEKILQVMSAAILILSKAPDTRGSFISSGGILTNDQLVCFVLLVHQSYLAKDN